MKRKKSISKRKAKIGLMFILPWLIGFLIFVFWPLIQSFYYSLNTIRIRPTGRAFRFDGFLNYQDIWLKDMFFVQQLLAFLVSSLLKVPIIVVFSLIIALLLNTKIKFKGFFRSIFFLPVVIASGPVLQQLMSQGATSIPILDTVSIGALLNNIMPMFLVTPILDLFSQIIIILWNSGVQILIFIASLQKIDKSLYEAAKIDGGSVWVCFWKITLPTLKPMIFLNAMYTLITLANSNDNNIINLIYVNMFSATRGYGFASAMAWMYALIVFAMVGVIYLLFRPKSNK
ncbi:sugar ABC transporter permease [Globicatella sp. PHS-GS-PNBC-21-1553]|uniref:carbohydrate ABC transporter permease n=1 Tax=Globicatella sp. PHS-GS-PNBC-21-1553 TaxID=2885764 RepID=UPI00298F0247|nr:sugar ABC transporter permease [Globicatella sp. PHS-GS-PNBC-21-1553]WPC09643.1 sugar ABC transporter permease [Globicatella sp. PHS-GS-PNBC-21-1553]